MTKKTTTLPDKPSRLIRLALDDLKSVERSKRYDVDMGYYHEPSSIGAKCSVCFAGAVIARTLGSDPDVYLRPAHFDADTESKLTALDCFRAGDVELGLEKLAIDRPKWMPAGVEMVDYDDDKRGFKRDMAKLAEILESNGL